MCVKYSVIYTIYSMFIVIYIKNYFKIRIGVVLNKNIYMISECQKLLSFYKMIKIHYILFFL